MIKQKNSQRVFVGLSGGVDSSVAAALLKEHGYEVAGVFMRFWSEDKKKENGCCSTGAEAAARLVTEKLNIPFYVWEFGREFKKTVVDYFLADLKAGRTPNPCVICNPQIKFGLFLEQAIKMGADFIATGHYTVIKKSFGSYKLFQAKDKTKDQSYFLYRLNQKQLSRIIFPLGNLTKKEVYRLAKKFDLPYRQGESFDVCFIDDYRRFLKKYLKMKPGKIIDLAGNVLGSHQGLALYTLGQRTGVGGPGPFYAVKKDSRKNILSVSNNERDLYQREILTEKINWLSGQLPKAPLKCKIKIRYQSKVAKAVVKLYSKSRVRIVFDRPQWAPTPGQSAVFYSPKGEVLGGGIIKK